MNAQFSKRLELGESWPEFRARLDHTNQKIRKPAGIQLPQSVQYRTQLSGIQVSGIWIITVLFISFPVPLPSPDVCIEMSRAPPHRQWVRPRSFLFPASSWRQGSLQGQGQQPRFSSCAQPTLVGIQEWKNLAGDLCQGKAFLKRSLFCWLATLGWVNR